MVMEEKLASPSRAAFKPVPDRGGSGGRKGGACPPEPSLGPDEEGEVPLDRDAVDGDAAAWVHRDREAGGR